MSNRQRRTKARRHQRRTKVAAGAGLALGATLGIAGTAHATDFTVTNVNDSGAGSLRQAVLDANNTAGADRVLFQAGLSGTIDLSSNQLSISDPVDIQGPGAGTLTVRGTGNNRVAYVHPGDGQSVTVSGLTLSGNGNTTNGGIFWSGGTASDSNLTISNSVLTGSHSNDNGGAIYVYYGSLQVESSTISGNSADNAGGGIYFNDTDSPSAIRNSTISGNVVTDVGSFGDGGALYLDNDAPLSPILLENSTLSGNSVPDQGGAIYDFSNDGDPSALTIDSSTIADNSAGAFGGGIYQYYGETIRNTIIANNTAEDGSDLAGPTDPTPTTGRPAAVSFSLIEHLGSTTPISETGPNIFGQDPQLGPLASNGGATQTQALSATSPAIDHGSTAVGQDQRGSGRPADLDTVANAAGGNGADIGAFEVAPTCKGRTATLFSTGSHKLTGTKNADVIVGTSGKDKINAKAGNDLVCALGGKDTIKGGKGKDTLLGGAGKDKLIGGPGKDKLKGGKGKDVQQQ
jgi:parallel beta-helix repeat protein